MSLKLTYTEDKTGQVRTDSYHRITFLNRDLSEKYMSILIKIYASKADYEAGKNPCDLETIGVSGEDFDTYFSKEVLETQGNTLESKAYEFIKLIDIEDKETKYSDLRFNYKNNSVDV